MRPCQPARRFAGRVAAKHDVTLPHYFVTLQKPHQPRPTQVSLRRREKAERELWACPACRPGDRALEIQMIQLASPPASGVETEVQQPHSLSRLDASPKWPDLPQAVIIALHLITDSALVAGERFWKPRFRTRALSDLNP